jgi:dihydropteroate synthase
MGMAASAGVKETNIILDPGIGFGKTLEDNIEIMRRLDEFRCFGRPLCIGVSRKSFIGNILNEGKPEKRDEGTASAVALAISKKVDIIRVHNTDFMRKITLVADRIIRR